MHFLISAVILLFLALLPLLFVGACTTLFDALRYRTEDLGPTLHARAAYKDLWMNLIPRVEYPKGAGYTRSTFEIARSEPDSDEETWAAIPQVSQNANGACSLTYDQVYIGEHENTYSPEMKGLMGPVVCQDEFTMAWKTEAFWVKYFTRLEQRNKKTIVNRIGNVYRHYSYKAAASAGFGFVSGRWAISQPPPSSVDMSDYLAGGQLGLPDSELTQEMLDATAIELIQEGAADGDTTDWISMGEDGPQFPLYIGMDMSHRLALNNSEFRSDLNQSFQGWKDMNPVIQRLCASRILKNFRHIINVFPARWIYVPNGTTINFTATGLKSNSGTVTTYANTSGAAQLVRIPTFVNSTASADATKGKAAVTNGVWNDPNVTVTAGSSTGVAQFESAEVLNPLVMNMQVLLPVNSMPGMTLTAQNYFGEWKFVTGNDAFLGIAGCTGITDPMHKQGRHFGEFRTAWEPIHPIFGRMLLFKRCASAFDVSRCS